jgi:UDP-2,3-diacylglucosamine pyrophosphatase LpxH
MTTRITYRSVFISDLHLGSSSARAADAAAFLKHIDCSTLYLVGDVIDMWRLRSRWHWPEEHNRVVHRILKMAKRGTRVVFIPGNHDEHARQFIGMNFGGVEVMRDAVHRTADGRTLLVTHGDEIDVVIRHARVLSVLGSVAYDRLVVISRWYNRIRKVLGQSDWSLSQYLKLRVKSACKHIARFEESLEGEARRRGYHGVVCGHIHKAEVRRGEIDYFNCGDWVESCTALVEHDDGRLQVIDGLAFVAQFDVEPADLVEAADSEVPVLPVGPAPLRVSRR